MAMLDETYSSLFEELYYEYRVPMLRVAEAILHDFHLAEDAVSEAYIKIARNVEKLSGRSRQEIRGYLVIILKSCAIDIYRKRQGDWENLVELEAVPEQGQQPSAEDIVFSRESYRCLLGAITDLKDIYKDVMMLYYVYEHTTSEIAALLSLKENTVTARLSRGRRILMEALVKETERMQG